MKKTVTRTYSAYSRDAVELIGKLIRLGRLERKLTAQDLADRTGISRGLLQRIEKGDLKCEIGVVFELATIVGVKLFDPVSPTLTSHIERTEDKLALLPKYVRKSKRDVDDDF
jgi:transcriptional regulator with XRE-family HTH domain